MICLKEVKKFCKDYTQIENYEEAVDDNTQTWQCHHILGEILTRQQLLEHDFYYDVPACMLKFVTKAEHNSLHNKKHFSEESRKKISEARKGKHHSEETRIKISEAIKGKHQSEEHRRKLSEARKGKHRSYEARQKMSEAAKRRWAAKRRENNTLQGTV